MPRPEEIPIVSLPIDRLRPLVGEATIRAVKRDAAAAIERSPGRVYWNVNSTARGGGVAEMLRPILGYARGLGADMRWVALRATPEFFRITKRLHHALHGSIGDGSPLGAAE